MSQLSFAFCKDKTGQFGLVRQYDHGMLLVTFDDGDRWCKPVDLTFV